MPKQAVLDSVRFQDESCRKLGSEFYGDLLAHALADCESQKPFWDVLDAWQGNPLSALLPLRILGALHHLVLEDRASALSSADRNFELRFQHRR
jgi:hypothetical protein